MLDTLDSKSKSNPSITDDPKGRLTEDPATWGPKIDQMLFAALIADVESENPPSE
jgi:hypothetical protein